MIGIGISPFFSKVKGGYGAYTTAWYTQVLANGGTATPTELAALTVFENSLGSDVSEFDRLWIHGLSNQIAARISFVNPTSTLISLVNSPTFTAGQGFTGNGSTMYIDTNYNPFINGVNLSLNSNLFALYLLDNSSNTSNYGGSSASHSFYLIPKFSDNNFYTCDNTILDNNSPIVIPSSSGLLVMNRTANNNTNVFRNGTTLGATTTLSSAIPNSKLFLLAAKNPAGSAVAFDTRRLSFSALGSGIINQSNFYTALQTLGTTLGWAV